MNIAIITNEIFSISGMVRPTSAVWTHFVEYRDHERRIAKCKYCDKKYMVPNATKMSKHLEVCKRKPIVVSVPVYSAKDDDEDEPSVIVGSQELLIDHESLPVVNQDSPGSVTNSSTPFPAVLSPTPDVATGSCSESHSNKGVLKSFFDSMSKVESEKLNSAFAKAVYSSNLPLSFTDNNYWQLFFKQIRPSYKVPSRYDLSNSLLDKEYEEVTRFVDEKIKNADFVTVITDGWSNIRNEGIISYIVTTPTPIFYKSIETKDHRHTAVYISQELIKVIDEIGAQKITALVTDNASNMKGAWQIVQAQYPHIFTIGCAAHGLNLLLGDIFKIQTFQLIISNAKEVVKYVKNKQALLSVFNAKQKVKKGSASSTLKLPAETRWCSNLIMFRSLLNGKESLQETVLIEELNVDKKIRQVVLDNDMFWMSINSLVNMLEPICDGLTVIESDSATLSDVPRIFLCIKESLDTLVLTPLQTEEEEEVKNIIETRRMMFCQPIHYAAYILDPRYFHDNLDENDFRSGVDFISSFPVSESTTNVLAEFAKYTAHDSVYSNNSVWEAAKLLSPAVWWKGFFKNQSLCSVALRLFNIPPSSAACERIFSVFSNTHTLTRNRLDNERVSKLVSVRSNLVLQSKQLSLKAIEIESD